MPCPSDVPLPGRLGGQPAAAGALAVPGSAGALLVAARARNDAQRGLHCRRVHPAVRQHAHLGHVSSGGGGGGYKCHGLWGRVRVGVACDLATDR